MVNLELLDFLQKHPKTENGKHTHIIYAPSPGKSYTKNTLFANLQCHTSSSDLRLTQKPLIFYKICSEKWCFFQINIINNICI